MSLSPAEESELFRLGRDHGLVLHYPFHYEYEADKDLYSEKRNRADWHRGSEIRRLVELNRKKFPGIEFTMPRARAR